MRDKLTVGSCFSGIGGLEKGLEDTGGFETRWQIEIDPYASAVLKKHWPNVKRYSDITAIGGANLNQSMLFAEVFPARMFRSLASVPDSKGNDQLFGEKCSDSFARLSPDGSWQKMSQGYCQVMTDGSSETFSGTWPAQGTMRNGACFQRQEWEPRTLDEGCSYWPTPCVAADAPNLGSNKVNGPKSLIQVAREMWRTPTATEGQRGIGETARLIKEGKTHTKKGRQIQVTLDAQVRVYPTPWASDWKGAGSTLYRKDGKSRMDQLSYAVRFSTPQSRDFRTGQKERWEDEERSRNLNDQIGGQLNADWVSLLMGFPKDWTVVDGNVACRELQEVKKAECKDLNASEMPSSRPLRKK